VIFALLRPITDDDTIGVIGFTTLGRIACVGRDASTILSHRDFGLHDAEIGHDDITQRPFVGATRIGTHLEEVPLDGDKLYLGAAIVLNALRGLAVCAFKEDDTFIAVLAHESWIGTGQALCAREPWVRALFAGITHKSLVSALVAVGSGESRICAGLAILTAKTGVRAVVQTSAVASITIDRIAIITTLSRIDLAIPALNGAELNRLLSRALHHDGAGDRLAIV
jgi:hypothetical protein